MSELSRAGFAGSAPAHEIFGGVAACGSPAAVAEHLRGGPAAGPRPGGKACRRAAAYGMVLVAAGSARPGTHHDDAIELLSRLAEAKADLDAAAGDAPGAVAVTAALLRAARDHVEDTTIPCTEWATTAEIADVVLGRARELLHD
jgi:hypothetical protein